MRAAHVTKQYASTIASVFLIDLEGTVEGDNFAKGAEVEFFVNGTQNPGGIHVKKVKVLGPKKLKATIDVDADATVDDFDIQIMSRSAARIP